MWKSIFTRMLTRPIVSGELSVTYPDGETLGYGDGGVPSAAIRIDSEATLRTLCLQPDPGFGECYMDSRLVVENEDLDSVIELIVKNRRDGVFPMWIRAVNAARFGLRSLAHVSAFGDIPSLRGR